MQWNPNYLISTVYLSRTAPLYYALFEGITREGGVYSRAQVCLSSQREEGVQGRAGRATRFCCVN